MQDKYRGGCIEGAIREGFDNFYIVPNYVSHFIANSILPKDWYMKAQTVNRTVTLFDANGKVASITYGIINDTPDQKSIYERFLNG